MFKYHTFFQLFLGFPYGHHPQVILTDYNIEQQRLFRAFFVFVVVKSTFPIFVPFLFLSSPPPPQTRIKLPASHGTSPSWGPIGEVMITAKYTREMRRVLICREGGVVVVEICMWIDAPWGSERCGTQGEILGGPEWNKCLYVVGVVLELIL